MGCSVSSPSTCTKPRPRCRALSSALAGEEVVIAKDGKPLVKLVPIRVPEPSRRQAGAAAADGPGFDRTPEDVIDAFEGKAG